MINDKKIIAIIPARGGSKRLLGKNTKLLCGKPLISWTIEAAKKSKYLDTTVITSDDDVVRKIANDYDVAFLQRPELLANDNAVSADVLLHALNAQKIEFDLVVLLQPTSPLRTHYQIDQAIEVLLEKNAKSIVSVCKSDHSPIWSNLLPEDLSMKGFMLDKYAAQRSQDLEVFYRLNGAIYIVNIIDFVREKKFLTDESFAFLMNQQDSIDIDTEYDFICAEALMAHKLGT